MCESSPASVGGEQEVDERVELGATGEHARTLGAAVMVTAMVLYICPTGKRFGGLPGPAAHPCGRAAKALDDAGHAYETKSVRGGSFQFWTWPARAQDRAEVRELSGQNGVPILVLDDGKVVSGSGRIVRWAADNPPATAAS
ncbi:MAG: glutathione S-transferase N-terminal domain-containing protein [Thermoleophilaceae bacterium]